MSWRCGLRNTDRRVPRLDLTGIDRVITGGESDPKARPVEADWIREVRDQYDDHGLPFFKQWGGGEKEGLRQNSGREDLGRVP